MEATNRFRTLSLARAGARQLEMKGKAARAVVPCDVDVTDGTLAHARAVGDAIRFARRLLFRGIANNARLVNCSEPIRERAINLLTAEFAEIERSTDDPWKRLVARCKSIARHGIGNCHECSELTFLYLVVELNSLRIDQAWYPDRDHVATLVTSGEHVIRCDPWTTVALPVLQGHGNKKLDVDLMSIHMGSFGLGGGSGFGKLLRTSENLPKARLRMLDEAVKYLDGLKPEQRLSDEAILAAPTPPTTTRTGAAMDDGSLWPLSKSRPVTGFVHGDQRFDVDSYGVNDYFHALFNPLPRRDDSPFPAGCFDFADAIERLLGNDARPLLELINHHGFDPGAVAPLLAELFDLAIPDEPTRDEAARKLRAVWPADVETINS